MLRQPATEISKSLELSAGIDVRYYIGEHNNEIIDLYDGKYFIDDSSRANVKPEQNAAAADPNWVYEKLQVGDKVYRDYDGHVHQEGVFAQLEWTKKNLNAFVSGSVSNTGSSSNNDLMAPCGNGYVGNAVETCSESLDTSIFNRLFDVPIHQHLLLLSSMIE